MPTEKIEAGRQKILHEVQNLFAKTAAVRLDLGETSETLSIRHHDPLVRQCRACSYIAAWDDVHVTEQ